jgi:hypothetical protein
MRFYLVSWALWIGFFVMPVVVLGFGFNAFSGLEAPFIYLVGFVWGGGGMGIAMYVAGRVA